MEEPMMNKSLQFVASASVVALGFISAAAFSDDGGVRVASLRPLVSFVGADTRIAERQCQRLDNQHDWELFWLKHEGKAGRPEDYNQYRRTGAPVIDFDECMVIAVTESPGALNAGITAVSITENDEQITFDYDDMFYQAQEGTSAPGNAYGYFVLPRSAKPVVVRHNVQEGGTRYTGGPPVWSEVARFDALE
jgi:hypothetical protein